MTPAAPMDRRTANGAGSLIISFLLVLVVCW
jgi:hypothetical protein